MKPYILVLSALLSALNATPTAAVPIADIPDQCVLKNSGPNLIEFTVTVPGPFNITLLSLKPLLIPQESITVAGPPGQTVTISYGVAPEQTGTATLLISIFSVVTVPALTEIPVLITVAPPLSIDCPANIEVVTDIGACDAVVNFSPITTGGCGPALVDCAPPSGSLFPLGTTTVLCTAQSGSSMDDCEFDVIVAASAPSVFGLTCPENIVLPLPSGQSQVFVTYSAELAASCGIVPVVCDPPSGSPFALGAAGVTCTADNGAGETASCTFTVTVEPSDPTNRCPLGKGAWKHLVEWPVETLMLGAQSYTQLELRELLHRAVKGDASVILASHLIPALLNVAHGSNPAPVSEAVTDAQQMLADLEGALPYGVKPSSGPGHAMTSVAAVLEQYNEGLLSTGCTE